MVNKFKYIKMTRREKALLEIVFAEIQGCQDTVEVNVVIDSWVKANDLHPEKVKILSREEMTKMLKGTERV